MIVNRSKKSEFKHKQGKPLALNLSNNAARKLLHKYQSV